nr:PREDICTED: uncharacterized protein LOC109031350 [Bemisia tabaci]
MSTIGQVIFWLYFTCLLESAFGYDIPASYHPNHTIPSHAIDLSTWSADDTITAIRRGSITVRHYITSVLDHAQRISPLNAFITLLPDEALRAADAIDSTIARGHSPPLAGLAIVVKDSINLAGYPTTAGTAALLHNRPPSTAPTLQRLIAAGAIVIGQTNMHELAWGITSTNLQPFAGPVHNPYAFQKIPGGSSGGTAVAVATRVVTCGLGTDTGGSSRIPAALTGTVGYHPSVGNGGPERRYHDEDAIVPLSPMLDTVGLVCLDVEGIALLDSIITGRPRVTRPAKLRGLRLGVPPVLWSNLDVELERVVLGAARKLSDHGVVLVRDDIPNLTTIGRFVQLITYHDPLTAFPAYLRANGVAGVDLRSIVAGIASPDVRTAFEMILNDVYGPQYPYIVTVLRPFLQQLYADYFSRTGVDAILFPTTILPAVRIDYVNGSGNVSINGGPPVDTDAAFERNTDPGASAGLPGLSIPAGMTASGLPVGIEIDGPVGSDERMFAIGLAIEKVLGPVPPPKGYPLSV